MDLTPKEAKCRHCSTTNPVSTPNFLDSLNVEQLRYCINAANQRLTALTAQKKVRIWQLCNDLYVIKNYREEEYLMAAGDLKDLAEQAYAKGEFSPFSLEPKKIYESEVHEYFP